MASHVCGRLRFIFGDQLNRKISSLCGIDLDKDVVLMTEVVEERYLSVYADAYEWVELPNTHGMALFADGGVLSSKPYAASGKYIYRMSDYCDHCRYDVKKTTGPDACPFNFLYWNFLAENRDKLARNPRMAMIYRTLDRMSSDRVSSLQKQAQGSLESV